MDVVYVVGPSARSGSATDELRYSLRSLRNLPHSRVLVAGWVPDWMRNVTHIPTVQNGTKWENAWRNLQAALPHVESDEFVLMNDDFFILKPLDRMPVMHREQWGPHHSPGNEYQRAKARVRQILAANGISEVTSYELHVPMVYNRARLMRMVAKYGKHRIGGYQRTLYGNLYRIGGSFMEDVKTTSKRLPLDGRFVSTNEASFRGGTVGRMVRDLFPDVSPYEGGR